ncbi:MAG: carboxypeptidase-like regulatory domain-containing protein, partial [Candidatus Neomarinimicrobiota bacterium]|nr:carboxypeptidase-like regulatory domain-containing protein [Candidatus Neomarinimicrobiota bacterium]
MKKQIINNFSLIIFVLSVSILTAQNWQGGGRGNKPAICEVSGTIVDSESGNPIEYASVSVLRKDGGIETGGVTSSDGKFRIGEITPGNYTLKI